jgi:hypothetical protein
MNGAKAMKKLSLYHAVGNNRGIALIVTLMLLTILLCITAAGLSLSQLSLKASANLKVRSLAFSIAEAGLNHAWQELGNGDGTNDFPAVYAAIGVTTFMSNASFGAGSYTVTGQKVSGLDQRVEVTASSCIPAASPCPDGNSKAVIKAQFRGKPSYNYAILTSGNMSLGGGAITDSFNSDVAPYNPSAPGNEGSVRSSAGNLSITGGPTQVNGDATAGGIFDPSSGTAKVTGTWTEGAPPALIPPVNSPCTSYSSGSGITGGTYLSATGQLVGTAGQTITLSNGTYCLSSVTLSGNSTLTVSGHVTIYLTAHSDMSGGTLANTTGLAENFTIYSSVVSAATGISIAGGSQAYFTIYAPNANVAFSGNSSMYGATVAGSFTVSGGGQIHYDQALSNGGWNVDLVAWREVF